MKSIISYHKTQQTSYQTAASGFQILEKEINFESNRTQNVFFPGPYPKMEIFQRPKCMDTREFDEYMYHSWSRYFQKWSFLDLFNAKNGHFPGRFYKLRWFFVLFSFFSNFDWKQQVECRLNSEYRRICLRVLERAETPLLFPTCGPTGSGKSSFMNKFKADVRERRCIGPWNYPELTRMNIL